MANVLVSTRYTSPGAYIGRVQTPAPVGINQSRTPCYVGRGAVLQTMFEQPVPRAYMSALPVTFSSAPPYLATLARTAVNDRTIARLYRSNGTAVPLNKWTFVSSQSNGVYDQVLIYPEVYDNNATYYLDYQSNDRTLRDPIPFSALRQMIQVGDVQGQNRYVEGRDYFVPMEVTATTRGATNGHASPSYSAVVHTGAGLATVVPDATSAYTHPYTRKYILTVSAVVGNDVTFTWVATSQSGQNAADAVSDLPLVLAGTPPSMTVDVVAAAGVGVPLVSTTLGAPDSLGVALVLSIVPGDYTVTDTYTFYAIAPQLVELDEAYSNTEQFESYSPVTTDLVVGSTGGMSVNSNSAYTGTSNRKYVFQCTAVAGAPGTRTATIKWQGYGEGAPTYGTIMLDETSTALSATNRTVEAGITVNFSYGATNFAMTSGGDQFHLTAYAPRLLPSHKDARSYSLTVSAAAPNAVSFAYLGSNPEAGANVATAAGVSGLVNMPGALRVYFRNVGGSTMIVGAVVYASGDTFTFTSAPAADANLNSPLMDWTLRTRLSETFTSSSVLTDVVGSLTGVAGARYIVLMRTPSITSYVEHHTVPLVGPFTITTTRRRLLSDGTLTNLSVTDSGLALTQVAAGSTPGPDEYTVDPVTGVITFNAAQLGVDVVVTYDGAQLNHVVSTTTGAEITHTAVPNAQGTAYTSFVLLPGYSPGSNFEVAYVWGGLEPDPGNTYYITADRQRPDSMYNTPITCYNGIAMRKVLGPIATDNDLMIAGILALEDVTAPAAMFVQAKDADGDGVYSTVDYQTAMQATESTGRLTDVVPLAAFAILADSLNSNEQMNDPFQRKDRALWVGTPIGTTIGDTDTPNSKIYLATRTMQLYGENEARGTRILIGNSYVTKAIQMRDGSTVTVDKDGSFLAAVAAAQNAAFTDPGTMLLRRNVPGFSYIETYEEGDELRLGGASILYASDVGSGVYRWNESVTVDKSSADNNEISALNQRMFVTRDLRETLDANLVAFVPDSLETGLSTIVGMIASKLGEYVARGIIAPFTDDAGNSRPIDPTTDIQAMRDATDKTLYYFRYWFNVRYGIKRMYGLFSVDRKFWG